MANINILQRYMDELNKKYPNIISELTTPSDEDEYNKIRSGIYEDKTEEYVKKFKSLFPEPKPADFSGEEKELKDRSISTGLGTIIGAISTAFGTPVEYTGEIVSKNVGMLEALSSDLKKRKEADKATYEKRLNDYYTNLIQYTMNEATRDLNKATMAINLQNMKEENQLKRLNTIANITKTISDIDADAVANKLRQAEIKKLQTETQKLSQEISPNELKNKNVFSALNPMNEIVSSIQKMRNDITLKQMLIQNLQSQLSQTKSPEERTKIQQSIDDYKTDIESYQKIINNSTELFNIYLSAIKDYIQNFHSQLNQGTNAPLLDWNNLLNSLNSGSNNTGDKK